jgi:hypothetical protein
MNDAAPRLEFGGRQFTDVAEIEFSQTHLRPRATPPRQKMFLRRGDFSGLRTSDLESMRRLHSILTLLLLAASAMSLLAAQGSTAPGIHDEKPAGCHEHRRKAPVHPASDYACCVAGHGSAVVQASCVPQGQHVSIGFVLTAPSLQPPELYGVAVLQTYSGTPPHETPLRI